MKLNLLIIFVLFISSSLFSLSSAEEEEQRLIQFSETHKEWLPVSVVEKLITSREINFMDITDYQYQYEQYENNNFKFKKTMAVLPLPVDPVQQSTVKAYLPRADVNRAVLTINSLSEFYTRYFKSDTGVSSAKWLQSQYVNIAAQNGRSDIIVSNITNPSFPQPNVVATIPGNGPNKAQIVVIGGHLDSVGSTATGRSPGADDDATGSATVLEVFRVLVEAKYKPDFTIRFFGYAAEEGGLLGSQGIAQDYQRNNVAVHAALQLDMTGYTSTGTPNVGIVTDFTSAELNAFIRKLISTYTTLVQSNKVCGYACSDHASWNRTGIRSSFPLETVSNPAIHSQNDVIGRLNVPQMLQFIYLGIAYVVEVGGVVA